MQTQDDGGEGLTTNGRKEHGWERISRIALMYVKLSV